MTLPALPIGMVITLVIAMIIDTICATKCEGKKRLIAIIENISLLIATVLIYVSIYIMDLINSKYVWIAFVVGLFYLLIMDIITHKRFIKKMGHVLGLVIISLIILFYFCFTRYELQTQFYQPCWSPNGKQIAFFMEKALYRYHLGFPFSLWSPDDIWKKYYLCTLDYDGGNFKQIREMHIPASFNISWSGNGSIVYLQENRETNQKEIYKINPDNGESEKLFEYNKNISLWPVWLSPDENYLVGTYSITKDIHTFLENGIMIIGKEQKKELKRFSYKPYTDISIVYGSYTENLFAYYENKSKTNESIGYKTFIRYSLDTDKIEKIKVAIKSDKTPEEKLMVGLDMYGLSPDRSMSTGDVFRSYNKKYGIERTKRSYLFNIFVK